VIGAHYDTEAHPPGFVGANDGAAGTAAVVELAKALETELPEGHREVRFVLFDGEEEPLGCPDIRFEQCALRGSKAYAAAHAGEVGEMILLDYVANAGLKLPREGNSDPALWSRLRQAAQDVGVEDYFPGGEQPAIIDDHVPFIRAGIPSIDLIDFSYEHADTLEDTPDKLDPAALDAVGEAVAALVVVEAAP
jgi:Zn-dependent M28 family amino/carboxypeptidase